MIFLPMYTLSYTDDDTDFGGRKGVYVKIDDFSGKNPV